MPKREVIGYLTVGSRNVPLKLGTDREVGGTVGERRPNETRSVDPKNGHIFKSHKKTNRKEGMGSETEMSKETDLIFILVCNCPRRNVRSVTTVNKSG